MVTRSGYRMRTDSTSVPSCSFQSVLRVVSSSQLMWRITDIRSGNIASASFSRDADGMFVHSAGSCAYRVK